MTHIAVGSFLPAVKLPSADAACERCRAYLRELEAHHDDFAAWDGRVVVVVPGALEAALQLREAVGVRSSVAADPEGRAPFAGEAGPALLVADRYGQLYHLARGGAEHRLPEPRELEEWLKFLATQCPE
jgi:hypothetical protein